MRIINTFKTYGVTCVDLSDYSEVIKDISFRKDLHCLEIVQVEEKLISGHSEHITLKIINENEEVNYIVESSIKKYKKNKLSDIKNKKILYLFIILKKYLCKFPLNIGDYIVPKRTKLRYYSTSTGVSQNEEWLQIEGVPCKVIKENNDYIELNSFSSSGNRFFKINKDELYTDFYKCDIEGDYILDTYKYPSSKLEIIEFSKREDVMRLENNIKDIAKSMKFLEEIIKNKLMQMICSQGSNDCITIPMYKKYINKDLSLSSHERIGDPIFNRNKRWCPPLDMTYEDYEKSNSFPAPIGIRKKDFCLPSELIETLYELITQIFNFKNIEIDNSLKIKIEKRDTHICKWCNKEIDASLYRSKYKSEKNYIEICHRNPDGRFTKDNIYWGHGECNRRQGGYSEEERIKDAIRLIENNPEYHKYISKFQ